MRQKLDLGMDHQYVTQQDGRPFKNIKFSNLNINLEELTIRNYGNFIQAMRLDGSPTYNANQIFQILEAI